MFVFNKTNAAPGGGFNMQLRGISTLGARGEIQDGAANRFVDINPEDVASVEVLKRSFCCYLQSAG